MNSLNAKALNSMKQKLRKFAKQAGWEAKIEECRADASKYESEEEVVEVAAKKPAAKKTGAAKWAKGAASSTEEDQSSEDESSEEESSSEESSSEDDGKPKKTGISKWLKKPSKKAAAASSDEEEKKVAKKKKEAATAAVAAAESDDEGFQTVTDKKSSQVPVKEEAINLDNLFKKLKEAVEARGRKSTDKAAQVRLLHRMLHVAVSPHQKVKVLLVLVPSLFDYNASMNTHLAPETWKEAAKYLDELLTLLESNPHIRIRATLEEDEDEASNEAKSRTGEPVYLIGSIVGLTDRLDDEFYRSLQNIDPHSTEYIDRLRDEPVVYGLTVRAQKFADGAEAGVNEEQKEMTVLRRLEHLYYKVGKLFE